MRMRTALPTIALTVLFIVGAAFSHEVYAQEGLTKIAEDVYAYVNVTGAGPQNSFGANAGAIIGKDAILVIDTLISSKEAKRLIRDIRAVSDKPIKYVINTHYHLDHTFGNSEFQKIGAMIISHANDKTKELIHNESTLKNAQAFGLTDKDMEGTTVSHPTVTFTDKMEIDLGNQRIQLIYPNLSHTDGSILVYVPDKRLLFAGDILFTNYHPFIADGNLRSWVKVLNVILAMDVERIIPGHGPISSKKDVQDMKEYIIAFHRKAKQLMAKSGDLETIAAEMKKSMPLRAEGEWLIKANIQMGYLKKQ
jgi:cyclase